MQKKLGIHAAGEKLYKLANCIVCSNNDELYDTIISHWHNLLEKDTNIEFLHEKNIICKIPDLIENIEERMQFLDQNLYLQDDILTKVDRASMASSLEVRVPLLDHRIVQASWRLPLK